MGVTMRFKLFASFCIIFLFSRTVFADESDFGFTGEFRQHTLAVFSSPVDQFDGDESTANIQATKKVKALTIGLRNFSEPDSPEYEMFDYYAYHWPEYHEWWVGFIVVNYQDTTVPCKITMQIKGPKKSIITRKAVLQPNQATIFSAEVKLASKPGLYTLIGKMTGNGIGGGKTVTTRAYIYEVWD